MIEYLVLVTILIVPSIIIRKIIVRKPCGIGKAMIISFLIFLGTISALYYLADLRRSLVINVSGLTFALSFFILISRGGQNVEKRGTNPSKVSIINRAKEILNKSASETERNRVAFHRNNTEREKAGLKPLNWKAWISEE
jgi:hypothetical protein